MSDDAGSDQKVPSVYARLAAQFPTEAHKQVKKGGREQTYIPWTDKVDRFNEVLGADWSFRIVREGMTATEAWVLGEITATIDGVVAIRQQYGCEPIVKGQRETPTGDLFKIAGTDALSKAATLFGVGLYLSIKEEREEIEAEMRAAVEAEAKRLADERAANKPRPFVASPGAGQPGGSPMPSSNGGDSPVADPLHARWQRLVNEATRVKLPTLAKVKAIDPKAVSVAQLKVYADQLEAKLYEAREPAGAV